MPRLAVLSPSLVLGGAERSLVRLINALSQHGWSIDLIVFASGENELLAELHANVKVHVVGLCRSSNPMLWLSVYRKLRQIKPDALLGWSTYANLVACVLKWPGDRWRTILSERNYIPEIFSAKRLTPIRRWITLSAIKLLYRRADIITANSKESCYYLKRFIGGNVIYHQLPNMVEFTWLNKKSMKPHDVPEDLIGPKLLALGRLDSQKGFDIAIKAMARVREVRPWSMVIVGDGKERERLEIQADRLGLSEAVHFLGARIDPLSYYRWADIVIVPSRFEGFPNVALEAMACERAVICSDCMTGPAELTINGRYGVLVPCEDPVSLARAIIAIGDDPVRRKSLGEIAARHIANTYDVEVVWPAIERTFISHTQTP